MTTALLIPVILGAVAVVGGVIALLSKGSTPAVVAPAPTVVPVAPTPYPTCKDWVMTPNTFAEYAVSGQPCVFNSLTGELTPTGNIAPPGYSIRITNKAFGPGLIFRALGPVGQVPEANAGGWLEASTGDYIGEAGDGKGTTLSPPEPLLPLNPVVGDVRTVMVQPSYGGPPLKVVNRVISVANGVTKTTLVERPEATPRAYTMEFDGEFKTHIFGDVKPDGTVDALMWTRTSVGTSP